MTADQIPFAESQGRNQPRPRIPDPSTWGDVW